MIPTYYAKKFSITQFFWNIEGFPTPQTVSALWDNKFSKKLWDPYYPKIFQCQNIYETQGSPLRNFSVLWDKINYPKIVIPPFFIDNFFPYQKFSETQKHEFFSALWGKKLPTEKGDTPSLIRNFSIIEIFWNLEGFPYELFRYCETKKIRWKFVLPPPPLLSRIVFHTRNFLKHRRVPVRSFSVLWDKKFSVKPLCSPDQLCSPSYAWKFPIPELFWNTKGFPYEFFRHCETKNFQRKVMISLSYAKNFSIPEIFWNTEVFSNEFFWYWDKKFWTKSCIKYKNQWWNWCL